MLNVYVNDIGVTHTLTDRAKGGGRGLQTAWEKCARKSRDVQCSV